MLVDWGCGLKKREGKEAQRPLLSLEVRTRPPGPVPAKQAARARQLTQERKAPVLEGSDHFLACWHCPNSCSGKDTCKPEACSYLACPAARHYHQMVVPPFVCSATSRHGPTWQGDTVRAAKQQASCITPQTKLSAESTRYAMAKGTVSDARRVRIAEAECGSGFNFHTLGKDRRRSGSAHAIPRIRPRE